MTDFKMDDGKSFSLTDKVFSEDHKVRIPSDPSISWEEQAYDRLKVLYGVSKLLAKFESIEKTFPEILTLCSTAFPFVTAVLVEQRGKEIKTAMWHARNVDGKQVESAIKSSKEMYVFLTGTSNDEAAKLRALQMTSGALANVQARLKLNLAEPEKFIALPLFVDRLPAFGVLQLQGSRPLSEKDVEFTDALCDLVAISVDRYYRAQAEREQRLREAADSSLKLSQSENQVNTLEDERELRESFVSLLTHDLRTPLSAAKASAQLIHGQPEISEMTQSLASRVVANTARADQMISDLLDANRIRSGEGIALKIEKFDLAQWAKEILSELSSIHGDRYVLLGAKKIEGYWDRTGLRRVIENLCTNAVKYGAPDAPITVTLKSTDDNVSVRVHNEGEPIEASEQKTLFKQFRRAQTAHTSKKKGWGIGLTLVRGVTEAHGGTVEVESEVKIGTTFILSFPKDARKIVQPKENL